MKRHQPYKQYHPARRSAAHETRGQSWSGDSVEENISLCDSQTIEPVLIDALPRPGAILESGCGLGRWVFHLRRKGFDVTGIDLSMPAVQQALAYDPAAPIHCDDVLRSRFPDAFFAAAISLGVVEHFEEGPGKALDELKRVLKANGTLCISVPTQNLVRLLLTNRLKELYRWLKRRKGEDFVFEEYRYTRSEFSAYLQNAGFEILSMVPDDYLPPRNMGLFVDFPVLRHRHRKWELNTIGRVIQRILHSFSPWWTCAGTLWVCRKRQ